jgi:hypothetical protein
VLKFTISSLRVIDNTNDIKISSTTKITVSPYGGAECGGSRLSIEMTNHREIPMELEHAKLSTSSVRQEPHQPSHSLVNEIFSSRAMETRNSSSLEHASPDEGSIGRTEALTFCAD